MEIDDPRKLARQGGRDGKLTFPFFTIENVEPIDDGRSWLKRTAGVPPAHDREAGGTPAVRRLMTPPSL
jgi:hypothetical protein